MRLRPQDYQEHQNEIHAKLIAIMGDRLSAHIRSLQVSVHIGIMIRVPHRRPDCERAGSVRSNGTQAVIAVEKTSASRTQPPVTALDAVCDVHAQPGYY